MFEKIRTKIDTTIESFVLKYINNRARELDLPVTDVEIHEMKFKLEKDGNIDVSINVSGKLNVYQLINFLDQ